jgi:hypothetical protein
MAWGGLPGGAAWLEGRWLEGRARGGRGTVLEGGEGPEDTLDVGAGSAFRCSSSADLMRDPRSITSLHTPHLASRLDKPHMPCKRIPYRRWMQVHREWNAW